jgi:hypothetical protein
MCLVTVRSSSCYDNRSCKMSDLKALYFTLIRIDYLLVYSPNDRRSTVDPPLRNSKCTCNFEQCSRTKAGARGLNQESHMIGEDDHVIYLPPSNGLLATHAIVTSPPSKVHLSHPFSYRSPEHRKPSQNIKFRSHPNMRTASQANCNLGKYSI